MRKLKKQDIIITIVFVAAMCAIIGVTTLVYRLNDKKEKAMHNEITQEALLEMGIDDAENSEIALIGCYENRAAKEDEIFIYALRLDGKTYIVTVWKKGWELSRVSVAGEITEQEEMLWKKK